MENLYDRYGRLHDYVRISITDHCSLRCVYCMPEEGLPFFSSDRLLSLDEIVQMVKNFVDLGVNKVRITGGEPLLRKDAADIVRRIHAIPEITDISITTNGLLLKKKAKILKEAGLDRINISLDTLRADKYRNITRGGNIQQVLDGIQAAIRWHFKQIKLNVVLLKGINDDEILDFLHYSYNHNVNVRFIEVMPISNPIDKWQNEYVGLNKIFYLCDNNHIKYHPFDLPGNGPSENYRIDGAAGSFGLIHPISDRFCETCNRLRVTADGYLKACLYWNEEFNIRPAIPHKEEFCRLVHQALNNKPLNHKMGLNDMGKRVNGSSTWRHMSQIGG
ncbi:GTP 3',8-cyclase MoaA [Sporolactobacillus sp. CQH2019]|uniref:GTP 3',8-cyclase MoaA n=1 Tax=Sporolactobacillus sp. CQH2019 TaxID=3023512 RepID=UPI0023683B52|nr:GTP 3',8-cyclase MoaA [Sporolactobacillus sp. CQH2019]MDD9149614.1 GTP 3',8-cyclase MoaA [Sporolactobacillus sp. CQH2019]